jgi:tetratricopeptide (TPR) repeat protein
LAKLLQSRPAEERTEAERLQLATILVKAQRFHEAFTLAEPSLQPSGRASHGDAAWLAAFSAFHAGNLARAADIVDANFDDLIGAGHADAYVIRALVHFNGGELAEAEKLLTTLLEKEESHASAHDVLGRVLVAAGDADRGNRHIQRATELRDQLTQAEQKALRLSAISRALVAAWERKDYEACDEFIGEMLPLANRQQQFQLYRQLAALRAAQGREQEAREALAKAKQLSASEEP